MVPARDREEEEADWSNQDSLLFVSTQGACSMPGLAFENDAWLAGLFSEDFLRLLSQEQLSTPFPLEYCLNIALPH